MLLRHCRYLVLSAMREGRRRGSRGGGRPLCVFVMLDGINHRVGDDGEVGGAGTEVTGDS